MDTIRKGKEIFDTFPLDRTERCSFDASSLPKHVSDRLRENWERLYDCHTDERSHKLYSMLLRIVNGSKDCVEITKTNDGINILFSNYDFEQTYHNNTDAFNNFMCLMTVCTRLDSGSNDRIERSEEAELSKVTDAELYNAMNTIKKCCKEHYPIGCETCPLRCDENGICWTQQEVPIPQKWVLNVPGQYRVFA